MYSLAKKLLFALDPEMAHDLSIDCIGAAERLRILPLLSKPAVSSPVDIMGLRFPNAIGLAAGLDKNADCFNALGCLGFGFIEVGTVTPKPQPGNPQPRLFRLVDQEAIINRMGFNNKGVEHLVAQVQRRRYDGVLGINIGKNKVTPEERAVDDYLACLRSVYSVADYIAINISSPNTPGLRNLQFGENLDILLKAIKEEQKHLADATYRQVPIVVKIAPDMDVDALKGIADKLVAYGYEGIVATNTTVEREGVDSSKYRAEVGGLSGSPLREKSTQVIRVLAEHLQGKLPIIGVGGVLTGADAVEKIEAGASLVQIYSGFIFRGPSLVNEAAAAIKFNAKA